MARDFLSSLRFFRRLDKKQNCQKETIANGWAEVQCGKREWEDFYRRRWQHDKHGPLHPWRQLHRVLLLERLRKRRHHRLGDPEGGLPRLTGRTCLTTNRAGARGERLSPGISTARSG